MHGISSIETRKRTTWLLPVLMGIITLSWTQGMAAVNPDFGRITGTVVDAQSGEPMIGANVRVDGLAIGAIVDLNGHYMIKTVPSGTYTLVFTMIGYAQMKITKVQVVTGEVTKIDVRLNEEILEVEGITIEAEAVRNTEAALLKVRQRALTISDAISAEDISRGAQGDAAAAMSRVTGASVVDGKYVYIRGLGERYSTTQLNGSQIPSADPNGQSVQMDVFASNLVDNIVTEKTFTPDKPGNFTGGSVNIKTKSLPDGFTMSFSTSTKINTQSSFKDFLTYSGGAKDFLGYDDGTRDIPEPLRDPDVDVPSLLSAVRDVNPDGSPGPKAQTLNALTNSFSNVMVPGIKKGALGQGYSFSLGTRLPLFDRPLGLMGGFSLNRNVSSYSNGVSGIWKRTSSATTTLNNERLATDVKGSEETLWGGLLKATFLPSASHEIGINYLYNLSGEKMARSQTGVWPSSLPDPSTRYETRVLSFIEREMRSLQFNGKHVLETVGETEVEWTGSLIKSKQEEPDLRFFTNEYRVKEVNGVLDTIPNSYDISISNYAGPTRYHRDLEEKNRDFSLNITIPFKQWSGLTVRFKVGGAYLNKEHTFRERRFEFQQDLARYDNDPEVFFSEQSMGILPPSLQTNPRFVRFGNYLTDDTVIGNNYDGKQHIGAGYFMIDLPVTRRFKLIGGTRIEATRIDVASQDTTLARGKLDLNDWLPSVSMVYQIFNNMNLRWAYGQTLARPSFRELAPFTSFAFVGDYIFVGNNHLKRTLIDNLDFRWEWFSRPGEIYALSFFYKKFENPIERVIITTNGEVQFQNVDNALVTGIEMEFRKKLDQISPTLKNFQLGGNLSIVKSKVDIAPSELTIIRSLDPDAPGTRNLQGQSPYVLNLDAMYDNVDRGTLLSLHYNIFGRRLSEVSLGGTPDVFEKPVGVLDLTGSQRLWNNVTLKFSAKNILDPVIKKYHPFNGNEFVRSQFKRGRTISFGLSYKI